MEENKTPTAGILRIPCRGFSLPYDGAIDWVGSFLHVPRKCHIWHRTSGTVPHSRYRTVVIATSGTVPPTPAHPAPHIWHRTANTVTYQK